MFTDEQEDPGSRSDFSADDEDAATGRFDLSPEVDVVVFDRSVFFSHDNEEGDCDSPALELLLITLPAPLLLLLFPLFPLSPSRLDFVIGMRRASSISMVSGSKSSEEIVIGHGSASNRQEKK